MTLQSARVRKSKMNLDLATISYHTVTFPKSKDDKKHGLKSFYGFKFNGSFWEKSENLHLIETMMSAYTMIANAVGKNKKKKQI